MAPTCGIEVTKGLDHAKTEGAVQVVAVPIRANARSKVDGGARKDASWKNALEMFIFLE